MKKLFKIFIILFYFCCSICLEVEAIEAQNSTVTFLSVNNSSYFDVEIVQSKNGDFLLPVKQIADILEIKYDINHSKKEITFSDIKIDKNYVYKSGVRLSDRRNMHQEAGMIDNVKNELYVELELLKKIFNEQIELNQEDLSIAIMTEKKLSYIKEDVSVAQESEEISDIGAYKNVAIPQEKGLVTLDSIAVNNNISSNSASMIYQNIVNNTMTFSNSNTLTLKGEAFGGDYESSFSTNSYKDELFNFSGLNFKYKNKVNKIHYEIGSTTGFNNDEIILGNQLLGVQFCDYNPEKEDFTGLEGRVDADSLVNIYLDDKLYSTLSTYDGNYSASSYELLKNDAKKIEVKELKKDKTEVLLYTKHMEDNFASEMGFKGRVAKKAVVAGISGLGNRLFAQDGYLYEMNSRKFVLGTHYESLLSDKLVFQNNTFFDNLISYNKDALWAQNYYNNNSILNMGTYRNSNLMQGATSMSSLKYRFSDNLELSALFASSASRNILEDNQNALGYSFSFKSKYKKDDLNLDVELYNKTPNFYLSGAQYGFISDRLGAKVSSSFKIKNVGVGLRYNKYFTNLSEEFDTSVTSFDDFNLNVSANIKKFAKLRYSANGRFGRNNRGENLSYYHDLNLSKYFRSGVSLEGGFLNSYFASNFINSETSSDFASRFSNLYLRSGWNLPKNKGRIDLGHEVVSNISNSSENKYNILRANYTFPEFKRLTLNLGLSCKYTGQNSGLGYNAGVSYRMKSGSMITLGYRYDLDNGYLIDNMFIPTSTRHSINLSLNDTFAPTPSGLTSVGSKSETDGFVEVIAYLDKNKNNIFDDGDIGVKDVPIKLSWLNDIVYTGSDGKIPIATAQKGVYKVSVDSDSLQSNLSTRENLENGKLLLVQPQRSTTLELQMISSVGNIKGNLKIVDDFGRNHPIEDFIVVLHDENGVEVAYSTVDDYGDYYFSGIQPGKYTVMLDKSFLEDFNLEEYEQSGTKQIDIPFVYKDFVVLENQDLIYKAY